MTPRPSDKALTNSPRPLDAVLKTLFAGYAFQHDQIAAYRSLIVIAKAAAHPTKACEMTITEEMEAAKAIDGIIEDVMSRYLELSTAA